MARANDSSKEAAWRQHLARWQGSGQSVRGYCRQQGLSQANFYRWRRVLSQRDPARCGNGSAEPHFIPVHLERSCRESVLEVLLACGARVAIRRGFDAATLAQLLDVLEGRPC
jgi:hypothetical protein